MCFNQDQVRLLWPFCPVAEAVIRVYKVFLRKCTATHKLKVCHSSLQLLKLTHLYRNFCSRMWKLSRNGPKSKQRCAWIGPLSWAELAFALDTCENSRNFQWGKKWTALSKLLSITNWRWGNCGKQEQFTRETLCLRFMDFLTGLCLNHTDVDAVWISLWVEDKQKAYASLNSHWYST